MKTLKMFAVLFVLVGLISCSKETNLLTELTPETVDFRTQNYIELDGTYDITDVSFGGISQQFEAGEAQIRFEDNAFNLILANEVCEGLYSIVINDHEAELATPASIAFEGCEIGDYNIPVLLSDKMEQAQFIVEKAEVIAPKMDETEDGEETNEVAAFRLQVGDHHFLTAVKRTE